MPTWSGPRVALRDRHVGQCPFWLPRDPRVEFKYRRRCVHPAGHICEHSPTLIIDEEPSWTDL